MYEWQMRKIFIVKLGNFVKDFGFITYTQQLPLNFQAWNVGVFIY